MFTHSRLVGMAVGLLLALVCTSGVAYAADTPKGTDAPNYADSTVVQGIIQGLEAADDPWQAFSQLAPAARQAVIDFLTGASVETVSEIVYHPAPSAANQHGAQAASGQTCATHREASVLKNSVGGKIFTYESFTTWCWDGTQITTDPFFRVAGHVHQVLWEFVGNQSTSESGGQGQWSHSDYAQGYFRLCVPIKVVCIQHYYPEISKYQYGDGSFSGSATSY